MSRAAVHEHGSPERSAQHSHQHYPQLDEHWEDLGLARTTTSSSDRTSNVSSVEIHHDYDIKHNLNGTNIGNNAYAFSSNSMLSPTRADFTSSGSTVDEDEAWSPSTPQKGEDNGFLNVTPGQHTPKNPFNFTTQEYVAATRAKLARSSQENIPGKRRGHKYKHSSIHTSHQIFQPPAQRPPLAVPAALPVPTRKEAWGSISHNQNLRLGWSVAHLVVAALIQFVASGSLAMTALSRLMLFDAAGAISCVAVDIMSNFEVWNRSTIRHPFGLARADVLAGFGMSVFIAFMGLDIVSHGTQHALENLGDHEAHSPHSHVRPSTTSIMLAVAVATVTTLVSALALGNHARIGRTMQVPWLARWGDVLGNASHFLTLSCCVLILLLPLLSDSIFRIADPLTAFGIAFMMIAFGSRLGIRLGNILLMAYNQPADEQVVRRLIADIESDSSVSAVEEAQIWQVNYSLGLADLKIRYRASGYADEVAKMRKRIVSLVRTRLSGVYGETKGLRWDISIQVALEKD